MLKWKVLFVDQDIPNDEHNIPFIEWEVLNDVQDIPFVDWEVLRVERDFSNADIEGETLMPKDYIPTNDTELQAWLTNFAAVLSANIAPFGLVAADVTPLTTAQTNFNGAVTAQVAADAVFRQSVQVKKTRRVTLEQTLRPLVRRINNHPGMTDGLRAQLGITVPDRSPTRRNVGSEVPGLYLELRPGQVIIHFGTTPQNEQINGKPAWATGCNIYRKRSTETDFTLIAFDTDSPYVDTFKGAADDISYQVAYRGVKPTDIGVLSPEQIVAVGS